jgi:integrase
LEVDIQLTLPDGRPFRQRRKSPVRSESGTRRWAEAREREILALALRPKPQREEVTKKSKVPTLRDFAKRFIENYAQVENKPSEVAAKQSVLDHHLLPRFGGKRLDQITDEAIAGLKADLKTRGRTTKDGEEKGLSEKTINNILTVLRRMLRVAAEWKTIDRVDARIRLLKVPQQPVRFYEEEDLDALVRTAGEVHEQARLIALLGADAGLRLGEMISLEWPDVDFRREKINIERSEWHGQVGTTKGYRPRSVPMTRRLVDGLRAFRHLRGDRVLCEDDGAPLDRNSVKRWISSAQRRANLRATGAVHILRHTFCTRLAARGVPARTIMELAGHRSLATTLRYMHVFKGAPEAAIRSLEQPGALQTSGEILEKRSGGSGSEGNYS